MKHHPLCNGDDAFLGLIEGREFGKNSIICISHFETQDMMLAAILMWWLKVVKVLQK